MSAETRFFTLASSSSGTGSAISSATIPSQAARSCSGVASPFVSARRLKTPAYFLAS